MDMIGTPHETRVQDTTIVWGEMGDGPPLVLLHGLFDSHRTWRRVAPLLATKYCVLMPDLPGNGYSGRPDAPYTLDWNADVVSDWMAAIGVNTAHICGHSYGGGVVQWMLLNHRERIERLALVSSGGLGRGVALGMRLAAFPFFGSRITPFALRYGLPRVLKYISGTFGNMETDEQERFIEMSRIPGTEMAFQRTLTGVINVFGQYMQTSQRSEEVDDMPPVAMFWGEKDPIIPIRHGREAVKRSENITLTTYKKCGHYPHLDATEAFARDLLAFLDDPKARPARMGSKATA